MTYQNRTASITLSKAFPVYSMPDSLMLLAGGNGVSSSILLSLDHQSGTCFIPRFTGSNMSEHKARIAVENIAQADYPLNFKSVVLQVERNSQYVIGQKYTGAFYLKGLYATYPDKDVSTFVAESFMQRQLFSISPNPANDKLFIHTQESAQVADVELYNMSGYLQEVWSLDFSRTNCAAVQVGHLPRGVYVFRIKTSKVIETGKIVIR